MSPPSPQYRLTRHLQLGSPQPRPEAPSTDAVLWRSIRLAPFWKARGFHVFFHARTAAPTVLSYFAPVLALTGRGATPHLGQSTFLERRDNVVFDVAPTGPMHMPFFAPSRAVIPAPIQRLYSSHYGVRPASSFLSLLSLYLFQVLWSLANKKPQGKGCRTSAIGLLSRPPLGRHGATAWLSCLLGDCFFSRGCFRGYLLVFHRCAHILIVVPPARVSVVIAFSRHCLRGMRRRRDVGLT